MFKITLKVIAVIAVIFIILVVYGVYKEMSDKKFVNEIMQQSYSFYTQNDSLEGFCEQEITNSQKSELKTTCKEANGEVAIQVETPTKNYACRNGSPGLDESGEIIQGVICVEYELPELNTSFDGDERYVSSKPLQTYPEPNLCISQAEYEERLSQYNAKNTSIIFQAELNNLSFEAHAGVYSPYLNDVAGQHDITFAINSKSEICACNRGTDWEHIGKEVASFEYGTIDKDGVVAWDNTKSWRHPDYPISDSRSIDITQELGTFATYGPENERRLLAIGYDSGDGCYGMINNRLLKETKFWKVDDLVSESEVCGCAGRGV